MTQSMLVLAGGFGTRLRTAVGDVPKALAPVGARAFLYIQMEHWIAQGLRSFVFLLHHQADQIIRFLDAERTGLLRQCRIDWIVEPVPLGTGGAIANAVKELSMTENFLMTNADTWLGSSLQAMWGAEAPSIAVVKLDDASRYGQVRFDEQMRITRFDEKSQTRGQGWINAGICLLRTDDFRQWIGEPYSLEKTLFPELSEHRELGAVILDTDFIDIGVPDDYHRFCRWVEGGRKDPL